MAALLIFGLILGIAGVILLLVGLALIIANSNYEKEWYVWLFIGFGFAAAIAGLLMVLFDYLDTTKADVVKKINAYVENPKIFPNLSPNDIAEIERLLGN